MQRQRVFFFNDTATTEIYTLSLHDALPISVTVARPARRRRAGSAAPLRGTVTSDMTQATIRQHLPAWLSSASVSQRTEEHTSELQSRQYLVCRLLLEKK